MVLPRRPRRYRKKAPARRMRRRVPRALNQGGFSVTRQCTPIFISNSSVAGVTQQSPASGTCALTLGTPVTNPLISGHYDVPFTMDFNLSQINGFTDFTNIADRYKITKVDVKILYNANAVAGSAALGTFPSMLPIINWIPDHDDNGVQTAIQLREKMGLRSRTCGDGKFVKFSVRPVPANVLAPGTAYAVPTKSQWVNSSYTTVPHYGIKGYFQNWSLQTASSAVSCFTFELKYHIALRDLQ